MADTHHDFLHDYLKESYAFELERIDNIRQRISFISGFLLVLGSGFGSLLSNYRVTFHDHPSRDMLFLGTLSIAGAFFMVSAILAVSILLRGFRYASVKAPRDVLDHAIEWETYNANPLVEQKEDIEMQLKNQLRVVYANAATENRKLNAIRNSWLLNSMRCAFCSAVILIVPTTCLIHSKYVDQKPEATLRVEVTNPIKVK